MYAVGAVRKYAQYFTMKATVMAIVPTNEVADAQDYYLLRLS